MGIFTLIKRGMNRQKGTLVGIGLLLFVVCLSVLIALTVAFNAENYVQSEMSRLGYGDLTAWINGTDNLQALIAEIKSVQGVESVQAQPLIFSGYTLNGTRSDNEGQIIAYDAENCNYHFLTQDCSARLENINIAQGFICLSPSMQTTFNAKIGDTIRFNLSRRADYAEFTVAGWFEDAFMGSSMIDMKSFLISREDYEQLSRMLENISDFNRLARTGAMLHITSDGTKSVKDMNAAINAETSLSRYIEFVYTKKAIQGFMLILQNVFTGFLSAFAVLLMVVAMIVISHSVSSAVQQESHDMAILKTIGYTSSQLRIVQMMQYATGVFVGVVLAIVTGVTISSRIPNLMVTSTGLLMTSELPVGSLAAVLLGILLIFVGFILVRTSGIVRISPMQVLSGNNQNAMIGCSANKISCNTLLFSLAIRQILTEKRRYIGICCVSILLVLFLSIVGRMGA